MVHRRTSEDEDANGKVSAALDAPGVIGSGCWRGARVRPRTATRVRHVDTERACVASGSSERACVASGSSRRACVASGSSERACVASGSSNSLSSPRSAGAEDAPGDGTCGPGGRSRRIGTQRCGKIPRTRQDVGLSCDMGNYDRVQNRMTLAESTPGVGLPCGRVSGGRKMHGRMRAVATSVQAKQGESVRHDQAMYAEKRHQGIWRRVAQRSEGIPLAQAGSAQYRYRVPQSRSGTCRRDQGLP